MIYLPDGLTSNVKLFADDFSLFSIVHDIHSSASYLNKYLKFINEWVFQWKMSFNLDPISKLRRLSFQGNP